MNDDSLLTNTMPSNVYSSFNRSAIAATGTAVPFYVNSRQTHPFENKTRMHGAHLASLSSSSAAAVSISKGLERESDREYSLPLIQDVTRPNESPSMGSRPLQYFREPVRAYCNMRHFPSFTQISQTAKKRLLLRRFFFTLVCLAVVILVVALTILLILRFP